MALKMIQPLEITHFSNQKKFLVIEQTESYVYEDGKRGPQDGCKITVFDEKQKEKFVVKVKGQMALPFKQEDIDAEKVYAEFSNCIAKAYLNNGFINYSFSADSVKQSINTETERRIIKTQE